MKDSPTPRMLPTVNVPETLTDLCLDLLSQNISLCIDAVLPRELSERLFHMHTQADRPVDLHFGLSFLDPSRIVLKTVKFGRSVLTDEGLRLLLKHNLKSLDVTQCRCSPLSMLERINSDPGTLQELSLGNWTNSVTGPVPDHLKKLEIYKWKNAKQFSFSQLMSRLVKVEVLNLSSACDIVDFSPLSTLTRIKHLVLYRIPLSNDATKVLESIQSLSTLTHLDISSTGDNYSLPDTALSSIVTSLPNLIYLDISETNLAGRGVAKENYGTQCDIMGLVTRVNRPLEFLGLFETTYEACRRHHIPAKLITGDANEDQLMLAARMYMGRPRLVEKVLNEVYNLCREDDEKNPKNILQVILDAMEKHEKYKAIQISGSATLFFIVKGWNGQVFPTKIKKRVIRVLLNGMFSYKDDTYMLRNGCLCLCQFKIPQDVMFEYKRLVDILLFTATEISDALFIQRIAIYLLNSLACQVDGTHKHILGDAGAVEKMLTLIEDRLMHNICDDVMEVAWSTLWNVTDETAENCRHFLDGDGMNYFLACLEAFPGKEELLRNMMGLLGNVAEVASLRPRLMTPEFVKVFANLLLSRSDGIEVSYNAAGVLAHLCSDGDSAWTVQSPSRKSVLSVMNRCIASWDLSSERNINYRSFEPILGLLKVSHTPECQYWAVWALANLTKVYPNKYCNLVEIEGGLKLVEELIRTENTCIRDLARVVLDNCHRFNDKDYDDAQLEGVVNLSLSA